MIKNDNINDNKELQRPQRFSIRHPKYLSLIAAEKNNIALSYSYNELADGYLTDNLLKVHNSKKHQVSHSNYETHGQSDISNDRVVSLFKKRKFDSDKTRSMCLGTHVYYGQVALIDRSNLLNPPPPPPPPYMQIDILLFQRIDRQIEAEPVDFPLSPPCIPPS